MAEQAAGTIFFKSSIWPDRGPSLTRLTALAACSTDCTT